MDWVFMRRLIRISEHARKRMIKYGLIEEVVIGALREPDRVLVGHRGRKIAHRFKNRYVLRVVYEEDDTITVVTVYPARRDRYAEGV